MKPGSGTCRAYPLRRKEDNREGPGLGCTAELPRHFADLRDGTHGGASSRADKERLFAAAVTLLDPYARQPLNEINTDLLLGTGEVTATGVRRRTDGDWPLNVLDARRRIADFVLRAIVLLDECG